MNSRIVTQGSRLGRILAIAGALSLLACNAELRPEDDAPEGVPPTPVAETSAALKTARTAAPVKLTPQQAKELRRKILGNKVNDPSFRVGWNDGK